VLFVAVVPVVFWFCTPVAKFELPATLLPLLVLPYVAVVPVVAAVPP
jgi:hypothetical protein